MRTQVVSVLVCLYASSVFSDVTAWMSQCAAWRAQARAALQSRMPRGPPPVPAPHAARLAPWPNDNFANRIALAGAAGTAFANTHDGTLEPGEPWHGPAFGTNSLWWSWTAPSSGVFGFDTAGSLVSAVVAIYTGNTLTGLTRVAQAQLSMLSASVHATAGVTYQIAVCGADSAQQGGVQVNYYPQTASNPFVFQRGTNELYTPIAAQDGSVCFAPGNMYITVTARTNVAGLITESVLGIVRSTVGVTIRTKTGALLLYNTPLPGLANPYGVEDYDGRFLLACEYHTRRLVLFRVSRRGLQNVAEQTIPGSQAVFASWFTFKDIRVGFAQVDLFVMAENMGVTAFNKQLRRQLWTVPTANGILDNTDSPNGILCRRVDGWYTATATMYKKGVALYTQTIPLPPAPDFGVVRTAPDDRAGLLFWTAQHVYQTYTTNGPVSYVNKHGRVVINAQTLPGGNVYWGFGAGDGSLLYLARPEGPTTSVTAYKLRSPLVELARQSFSSFGEIWLTDGTVSILLRSNNPPPARNGLSQYDKNLRRATWNNPLTRGDELDYLGRGVFARTTYEPPSTIIVNVFDKRGSIIYQTFTY